MSKLQKAITRLRAKPVDYTWDELLSLMNALGYELRATGGQEVFRSGNQGIDFSA
jgi:hypothetical protein